MHLERLRAMSDDTGDTWDLSPNDVAAIRWAIGRAEVAGKLAEACRAMLNDQWADNCEQYIYGRQLAMDAVAEFES